MTNQNLEAERRLRANIKAAMNDCAMSKDDTHLIGQEDIGQYFLDPRQEKDCYFVLGSISARFDQSNDEPFTPESHRKIFLGWCDLNENLSWMWIIEDPSLSDSDDQTELCITGILPSPWADEPVTTYVAVTRNDGSLMVVRLDNESEVWIKVLEAKQGHRIECRVMSGGSLPDETEMLHLCFSDTEIASGDYQLAISVFDTLDGSFDLGKG